LDIDHVSTRCNSSTLYGWKTAFSVSTNRTDRQAVSTLRLWRDAIVLQVPLIRCNFSTLNGWKTIFSIRRDRTDRQALSPLDSGKTNYVLILLNEMPFSDRLRIENGLLLSVKPYRSKSCCFLDRIRLIMCIGQPSKSMLLRHLEGGNVAELGIAACICCTPFLCKLVLVI